MIFFDYHWHLNPNVQPIIVHMGFAYFLPHINHFFIGFPVFLWENENVIIDMDWVANYSSKK